MDHQETIGSLTPRRGKEERSNYQRFFHVMNQGWYIYTREGICGPFLQQQDMHTFLEEHIARHQPEPSESWRM